MVSVLDAGGLKTCSTSGCEIRSVGITQTKMLENSIGVKEIDFS